MNPASPAGSVPRATPRAGFPLLVAALACLAIPARAQLQHRGASPEGRVTQSVAFEDAWEDGGAGLGRDGTMDVVARREVAGSDGSLAHETHLLLFGTWGHHLYSYDEERVRRGMPDSTHLLALRRALDLDGDGHKELVIIERTLATRVALDDLGLPEDEPGPFFADATVSIRYLTRRDGALVEHELEPEAASAETKELLQAEWGPAVNAWLQLATADVDFLRERYEQARYRYGLVREWAESQFTAQELRELSPAIPLAGARPDDPRVLWLAATRRIGALPRWYQRR